MLVELAVDGVEVEPAVFEELPELAEESEESEEPEDDSDPDAGLDVLPPSVLLFPPPPPLPAFP